MKKTLLFTTTLLVGALASNAQITVTMADIAAPITVIQQAQDTMPTVTVGSSGISQTWNMSALNTHTTDTLNFISPSWTPLAGASAFPSANLAIEISNSGQPAYVYAYRTPSSMSILGQYAIQDFGGGPSPVIQENTPAEILTNFPSTYLSTFTQTYVSDGTIFFGYDPGIGFVIDSIRAKSTITKYSNVDAWGTITTPLISAVPCLRYYSTKHNTDSLFILSSLTGWVFFQETIDSSKSYSWWANGIGFPLVELQTNWAADTVTSASWLKATPAAGINDYTALAAVNVYPNPAQNEITFDLDASKVSSIQVYDVTGRMVASYPVSSAITKIDVASFANGMYSYSLIDRDDQLVNRGKFAIAK
jgi:hypothetical protein